MGKKSKTPAAPNYTKLAEQTAASTKDAQSQADWANRPDQTDIYGNKTSWTSTAQVDPATGKPMTKWSQQTTLSPQQQQALDSQMRLQSGMVGQAESMLGRAQGAMNEPFDTSGMQNWGAVPKAGNLQAGNLQAGNLDPSAYQTSGAGQGIMGQLDTGSLGGMPQADAAERQRIENMLYERQNPERERQQAALEGKLANMGLTRGSAAWNREMQRMGDQHSRERYDAMATGGNEMQRLFNMGMGQRQQGWNELQGAGQFQNAAQAQGFGQNMAQNAQNFGQQAAAGAQNFGQQATAGQQNFNQQAAAGAQNYNQQLGSSQLANSLRQQQMQEAQALRQMPLNEMNAFRSGQQVADPRFQSFTQSQRAGNVDYLGAGQQQYNSAMDAYNANQASKQGTMAGLGGLASTGFKFF